jgi:hypothetical protein
MHLRVVAHKADPQVTPMASPEGEAISGAEKQDNREPAEGPTGSCK